MNIDVIDGLGHDTATNMDRSRYPHAIRAESVSGMVIAIINRLGGNRLHRLRIFGHGTPGAQGVADSFHMTSPNTFISVDAGGRLQHAPILSLLIASFGENAFVELHGCSVARGYQGKMLLCQLSALWRVRVRGGIQDQDTSPGFEGRVATADHTAEGGIRYH